MKIRPLGAVVMAALICGVVAWAIVVVLFPDGAPREPDFPAIVIEEECPCGCGLVKDCQCEGCKLCTCRQAESDASQELEE